MNVRPLVSAILPYKLLSLILRKGPSLLNLVMKSANALMIASILVFAIASFGCENEEIDRDNSPETLAWRSKDSNWRVRAMVAQNENSPPEVLADLSRDSEWWVQCLVARNPNTPSRILDGLSRDIDPFVRACVIDNEIVPAGVG